MKKQTLSKDLMRRMDAWWRATNYLSVGQIYLFDNPLLREPLKPAHLKPRLLGHWGTTPGLNFVYTHLNRVIVEHDLNAMYIIGPGHGGPAIVSNVYLEGTWTETYPEVTQDLPGMKALFKQFEALSEQDDADEEKAALVARICAEIVGPMPLMASSSTWLALLTSTAAKAVAATSAPRAMMICLNMRSS